MTATSSPYRRYSSSHQSPAASRRPTSLRRVWRLAGAGVIVGVVVFVGLLAARYELAQRERQDELASALLVEHRQHVYSALESVRDELADPRYAQQLAKTCRQMAADRDLPTATLGRLVAALPKPTAIPADSTARLLSMRAEPPMAIAELTILDAKGKFIEGLSRVDFEVFQGGARLRRVEVARVVRQSTDQSVVLLFDCSTSMKGSPLQTAQKVGANFVDGMAGSSRMQIWKFSDQVTALTPSTAEREILTAAIDGLTAHGNTALYAGIESAIEALSKRSGHRSLVILTDGEDSTKAITPESLITLANQHQVELHVVGLLSGKIDAAILRSLADETHGSFHTAADGQGLMTAFRQIAGKLRQPAYRLVILDPVSIHEPLILRMDGLADLTLRL